MHLLLHAQRISSNSFDENNTLIHEELNGFVSNCGKVKLTAWLQAK